MTTGEEVKNGEEVLDPPLKLEPNSSCVQASFSFDAERSMDVPVEDAEGVTPGEEIRDGEED